MPKLFLSDHELAMLTREMALAEYDFRHSRVVPDRLTRVSHAQYVGYAERGATRSPRPIRRCWIGD